MKLIDADNVLSTINREIRLADDSNSEIMQHGKLGLNVAKLLIEDAKSESDGIVLQFINPMDKKPDVGRSILIQCKDYIAEGVYTKENEWYQYRWCAYILESEIIGWTYLSV